MSGSRRQRAEPETGPDSTKNSLEWQGMGAGFTESVRKSHTQEASSKVGGEGLEGGRQLLYLPTTHRPVLAGFSCVT